MFAAYLSFLALFPVYRQAVGEHSDMLRHDFDVVVQASLLDCQHTWVYQGEHEHEHVTLLGSPSVHHALDQAQCQQVVAVVHQASYP